MVAFVSGNGFKENNSTTSVMVTVTSVPLGGISWALVKHEGSSTSIVVSDGAGNMTPDPLGFLVNAAGSDLDGAMFFTTASATTGSVNYRATFGAARAFCQIAVGVWSYTGTITRNAGAQQATTTAGAGNAASSGAFSPDGGDLVIIGGWGNYFTANPSIRGLAAVTTVTAFGNSTSGTQGWFITTTSGFSNSDAWIHVGILGEALMFGVAFSATTAAAGGQVQPSLYGDLSGIGSPGRFFQDRLQRVIDCYRLKPA